MMRPLKEVSIQEEANREPFFLKYLSVFSVKIATNWRFKCLT
jgi:hypothetical protein